MLQKNESDREKYGAIHTAREISQQPRLWTEVYENILASKETIDEFLYSIKAKHKQIKVIFTGAGTSAFVGDIILPYIKKACLDRQFLFESIPTTNIVSNPYYYLEKDTPTIMVSFARSGNSPESLAATELGEDIIQNFYEVVLTCNREGDLFQEKQKSEKKLLLVMPEGSNDKGFAMTSSFTTMMLSALLLFQTRDLQTLEDTVKQMKITGQFILREKESPIMKIAQTHFRKIVFLGSGVFEGLSRESALKFLELTGGKIPTLFDTPLGFRHGPKSILDRDTLVVVFLSSNEYTRKYDLDLLKELFNEKDRGEIIVISHCEDMVAKAHCNDLLSAQVQNVEDDIYLTFVFVMFAQILAFYKSVEIGLFPDNPSPEGLVNRVVQGVNIHPYFSSLNKENPLHNKGRRI